MFIFFQCCRELYVGWSVWSINWCQRTYKICKVRNIMSFRNFSFMKKYLVCQKPKCNVSTFLQNRVGRADGSCHTRKCDFLDNQLRTVGDYLGTFEEFLSQIFNSISESLSFGKWFFFFSFWKSQTKPIFLLLIFSRKGMLISKKLIPTTLLLLL